MEVHHHPQLEHKPKPWKEYLLEGVMIFLAVTMGFFAENLRERITINDDTEKSMHAIVADLKSDLAMYKANLAVNAKCIHMCDTLTDMLAEKSAKTGHVYFLARNITAVFDYPRPNTRTFEQLKSGGSLHLIKNQAVLDSITDYYQSLKLLDLQNQILMQKVNEVHQANSLIFDGVVFAKIFRGSDKFIKINDSEVWVLEPKDNPPYLSNSRQDFNTVIMRYHYMKSLLVDNNGFEAAAMEQCKRLADFLEKEYR